MTMQILIGGDTIEDKEKIAAALKRVFETTGVKAEIHVFHRDFKALIRGRYQRAHEKAVSLQDQLLAILQEEEGWTRGSDLAMRLGTTHNYVKNSLIRNLRAAGYPIESHKFKGYQLLRRE